MENDHELIKQFQAGKQSAYDRLVKRHLQTTYLFFLKFIKDPMDAEDLAQDVFIKLFQSLHNFRFEAAFTSYLYRIQLNAANSVSFQAIIISIFSFFSFTTACSGCPITIVTDSNMIDKIVFFIVISPFIDLINLYPIHKERLQFHKYLPQNLSELVPYLQNMRLCLFP